MWLETEDLSPQVEKGIPASSIHTCKGPEARTPAGGVAGAALVWLGVRPREGVGDGGSGHTVGSPECQDQ